MSSAINKLKIITFIISTALSTASVSRYALSPTFSQQYWPEERSMIDGRDSPRSDAVTLYLLYNNSFLYLLHTYYIITLNITFFVIIIIILIHFIHIRTHFFIFV